MTIALAELVERLGLVKEDRAIGLAFPAPFSLEAMRSPSGRVRGEQGQQP